MEPCVHKGENVSRINPNGVTVDKEEIRMNFIPVIEVGLSQQEPRGEDTIPQTPTPQHPMLNHSSTL